MFCAPFCDFLDIVDFGIIHKDAPFVSFWKYLLGRFQCFKDV